MNHADLVAEEALLGTMLESPNTAPRILAVLRANDFALGLNASVFRAIEAVQTRGDRPDKVTVHAELAAQGSPVTYERLDALSAKADRLSWFQFVGVVQRHAAARALMEACADAQEALVKGTPAEVADALADRVMSIAMRKDDRLTSLGDVLPEVMAELERRRSEPGTTQGLLTGIAALDQVTTGAKPGQLWVVAGDTGSGKTSLAMQNVFFSALNQGAAWLVFNMEMTRQELAERAVSHCARKDSQCMRTGSMRAESMAEMNATAQELAKLPIYLEDQVFDIADIRSKARAWRAKYPRAMGGIVVDYLQLASAPDQLKRNEEVATVSRSLKKLAKQCGVPVIMLSQLNREGKKAERPPAKHDLRDSGTIEDDADVIILGHAVEPQASVNQRSRRVDLIIGKNRGGPIGRVPASFIGQNYRFEDVADDGWSE